MFSRLAKTLVVFGVSLCVFAATAHAQSGVVFEGTARYSLRYRGNAATTTASAQRLANYTVSSINGVRSILVLSKAPYRPGAGVAGLTIAQAVIGTLEPRTYLENIKLSGASALPRGSYRVLLLAVDGAGNILDGLTFSKKLSLGKAGNLPRRLVFSRAHGVETR